MLGSETKINSEKLKKKRFWGYFWLFWGILYGKMVISRDIRDFEKRFFFMRVPVIILFHLKLCPKNTKKLSDLEKIPWIAILTRVYREIQPFEGAKKGLLFEDLKLWDPENRSNFFKNRQKISFSFLMGFRVSIKFGVGISSACIEWSACIETECMHTGVVVIVSMHALHSYACTPIPNSQVHA